jgi:hypothetical protein
MRLMIIYVGHFLRMKYQMLYFRLDRLNPLDQRNWGVLKHEIVQAWCLVDEGASSSSSILGNGARKELDATRC